MRRLFYGVKDPGTSSQGSFYEIVNFFGAEYVNIV